MKNFKLLIFAILLLTVDIFSSPVEFPARHPKNGNFNRPLPEQMLDISPPGFCWWRCAPRGEVSYYLQIESDSGQLVYKSKLLDDPVHVPDRVLSSGTYFWSVDALDSTGQVIATRPAQKFSISENALELPWMEPEILLQRVPEEHPRLLFPKNKLKQIRATLHNSRQESYADLKTAADNALDYKLMTKPDFDRYDRESEYQMRRTAYRASYHEFTQVYNRGMVSMALMYQLSGEEKYGLAAKRHLLNLLDWELDGVASLELSFDEIGLRIARTAAQGYDWLYPLFSQEEHAAVRRMLIERGDQMLARLERRDFLNKSAYSHDGRLPGYLVEFSIVLAEEKRAQVWMDYAMRALLTVFPHWGGKDGGWAEGINYVLSYNERFITPLQSLFEATGYDMWRKPYFRNMRNFLLYCVSPMGEVAPFGDGEHISIESRAKNIYAILLFHALRYQDSATRWWIEQLPEKGGNSDRLEEMHRIILEDNLRPEKPNKLAPDRAFYGVGWAALHSDILNPENDLMLLFKSSPYGPVSHSHADQNSFAIIKGGHALAAPSGARYPQHQSPFHFNYTNLTIAHNALLVDGTGQIDRNSEAHGKIVDFKSTPHLGYVAGDAQKCYGEMLDFYQRHVVLIRPSVILVIDDLAGPSPFSLNWLLHSREKMRLDKDEQLIESFRFKESMHTQLITPGGFDFDMTNEWPIDPKQDYPMVTSEPPAKEWHFTATTRNKSKQHRIVSVMRVKENDVYPFCDVKITGGSIHLSGSFKEDKWSGIIQLNNASGKNGPLLVLNYYPASGETETIKITY
jgi:hypothetical protein